MYSRIVTSSALIASLSIGVESAAALDCGKADDAVSKVICASPDLVKADVALNEAWKGAQHGLIPRERERLLQNQKDWLSTRDSCVKFPKTPPAQCLAQTMALRTRFLAAIPGTPATSRLTIVTEDPSEAKNPGGSLYLMLFRFAEPRNEAERLFNAQVDASASSARGEVTSSGEACGSCEANAGMATPLITSDFISAPVEQSSYTGGAHGGGWTDVINIDLKKQRLSQAGDWFEGAGLKDVMRMCLKEVQAQVKESKAEDMDRSIDGSGQPSDTFKKAFSDISFWTFTGTSIDVNFPTETFNVYSAGSQGCKLSYENVTPKLKAGAVLPR
jgi:uncharacterized protein YecT (DUF1311 family)